MTIKPLAQQDREQYDKYAREYGTVFSSLAWLSIFEDKVNIYGIYNKGNELIGGFSLYKESKIGFSIYRNPPFTPSIGLFLKVDAMNPVSVMDTQKRILLIMADFIEGMRYSIVSFSFDRSIVDTQPFIWGEFKVVPGYTYIIDLSASLDDIWKRMSNERRKNVNKGLKDGLSVRMNGDREVIKTLVMKTFLRQDMQINEYYLNRILFDFAGDINSFSFVTLKNDDPVACSFYIYDSKTAYYLLGGYNHDNNHHGAGALSMWRAIKHAKELGLQYFDFEGSMVPQIEKYFRGFGGELTPYYRINKAKLPIEILLKFLKRELF